MTIQVEFGFYAVAFFTTVIILIYKLRRQKSQNNKLQSEIIESQRTSDQQRQQHQEQLLLAQKEMDQAITDAQSLVDQQVKTLREEAERVRKFYGEEAKKVEEEARKTITALQSELEPLRRYVQLADAEKTIADTLTRAMQEAEALQHEANVFLAAAKESSSAERLKAQERAKLIYEQAEARLTQATKDAGRIVAEADKQAKTIGGEAYEALRNYQTLENSSIAIRNKIEGYGEQYMVPTHSLLDELAAEFGYTSAGESLKSARAQSRRMVEQGEAASSEYVEPERRRDAVRFIVDAFNGKVDAILSRIRKDNYGTLEQEIRDAFNLVNLNGKAFRSTKMLDAYLDARLSELKWAIVVQELARRRMEEQREMRARIRDEEKARREYEQQLLAASKEEDAKKKAVEQKEQELAAARKTLETVAAQERATLEAKIAQMQEVQEGLRKDLATATEKTLTIAQRTREGHVYVISNIGAFGDGVYKIGQTRRPPEVRIDELGGASVPFEFDVHALIKSNNAPALEHLLHKRFLNMQMNKINSRKEFFRVSLRDIKEEVEKLQPGQDFTIVQWTDLADATQYRETQDIESNPEKLDKWLKRQEVIAERELRLDSMKLSVADVDDTGDATDYDTEIPTSTTVTP